MKKITTICSILSILSTLALMSCASARVIKLRPGQGGIIGINPGFKSVNDPEVRNAAMKEMEANCGVGRVKIIEEGYVKAGKEKIKSETFYGSSTSKTVDVQQWQIQYECID